MPEKKRTRESMTMKHTRHSRIRLRQRGYRKDDIELILENGTEISQERIMLRRRDVENAVKKLKREITMIQRSVGIRGVSRGSSRAALSYSERNRLRRMPAGQTDPRRGGVRRAASERTESQRSGAESAPGVQRTPEADQTGIGGGRNSSERRSGRPMAMERARRGGIRLRQRGSKKCGVDPTHETEAENLHKKIIAGRRSAGEEIRKRRRKIAALERLKDTIIVIADGHLVTAYHASGGKVSTGASTPRRRRAAT